MLLIIAVAFFASLLTFFAGFGLGTLLLPIFALFFPPETAVALTAIVHFLNNIFKLGLVGKHINKKILLRFGIPAVIASFFGAKLLTELVSNPPIYVYQLFGGEFQITPINLAIGLLMFLFAVMELFSLLKKWEFGNNALWFGGVLSGFFGGLSGHQGAMRSAFLAKSGLGKEAFIATGVAVSCFVDFVRISIYSSKFASESWSENWRILLFAVISAFAGAILGKKLLNKTKVQSLYLFVAIALMVFGLLLAGGVLSSNTK